MAASRSSHASSPPHVINHCGGRIDSFPLAPSCLSFHCLSVRTRSDSRTGPLISITPAVPCFGEDLNCNDESIWPRISVLMDTSAQVAVLAVSSILSAPPFLTTLMVSFPGGRPDRIKNALPLDHPSGVIRPPVVSTFQNSLTTLTGELCCGIGVCAPAAIRAAISGNMTIDNPVIAGFRRIDLILALHNAGVPAGLV